MGQKNKAKEKENFSRDYKQRVGGSFKRKNFSNVLEYTSLLKAVFGAEIIKSLCMLDRSSLATEYFLP